MKTGRELADEIASGEDRSFWWLGQLGFAVKLCGKTLFLDAFLSPLPERLVAPLLEPADLCGADYILGSHDHLDHIEWEVWREAAARSPRPKFILPRAVLDSAGDCGIPSERLIGLDDGESVRLGELKISGVASAHEFLSPDPRTGRHLFLGYVVEGGGAAFYHSGDTCLYEGLAARLRRWGRLDAMFFPINGRDGKRLRTGIIGNMTYQEAADFAGGLEPGLAVPAHYDMFAGNGENPYLFADYLEAKYPRQRFWIGAHGERVPF